MGEGERSASGHERLEPGRHLMTWFRAIVFPTAILFSLWTGLAIGPHRHLTIATLFLVVIPLLCVGLWLLFAFRGQQTTMPGRSEAQQVGSRPEIR